MNLKSIAGIDVNGKRVLVRVDFNVPLQEEQGVISVGDDTRIRAALPTITYLLGHGAKVVLCSHLGRPKGVDEKLRLAPIAPVLQELLNGNAENEPSAGSHLRRQLELVSQESLAASTLPAGLAGLAEQGVESFKVIALSECIGPAVLAAIDAAAPGELLLLENLRFHPEEEKNDPQFARALAELADLYVSDAFGTVHRAHASTEGVAHLLPAFCGFLVESEVRALSAVISNPKKPLVIVMGGAKISDKIEVLENLLPLADSVLIGGAMANTFLGAQGSAIGKSLAEPPMYETARRLVALADEKGVMLLFPIDYVVTDSLEDPSYVEVKLHYEIGPEDIIADIGPKTIASYAEAIEQAQTVFWNGPMGVFETDEFANGTLGIALALASLHDTAMTVIGGGESVEAANRAGVADRIHHISTGGGASLEFVGGRELPGLSVLRRS